MSDTYNNDRIYLAALAAKADSDVHVESDVCFTNEWLPGHVSFKFAPPYMMAVITPTGATGREYPAIRVRCKFLWPSDGAPDASQLVGKLARMYGIVNIWADNLRMLGCDQGTVEEKVALLNMLYLKLHTGVVNFRFKKMDGTLRDARGTLQDVAHLVKGTASEKQKARNDMFRYYDVDKQEFRGFKIDKLVSVG